MNEAERFTENLTADNYQRLLLKNPMSYLEMAFKIQPDMSAFGMITTAENKFSLRKPDFIFYKSGTNILSDTGRFDNKSPGVKERYKSMLLAKKPAWSLPFYNSQIDSREIT